MTDDLDLAAELADTSKLTEFNGRPVERTTIAVTNAGDGLSNALKIDPQEFDHGDVVDVVLRCAVSKVRFDPIDKDNLDGPLIRVHVLRAGTATIIDSMVVDEAIRDQEERIALAIEEAKGIQRLALDDVDPEPGSFEAAAAAFQGDGSD